MNGDAGFVVPVDLVHEHAHAVDEVSAAVDLARQAVREVSMQSQAYGQLCQFLPALLSPVFGAGTDTMSSSVDALRDTAGRLRTVAANTSSADARSARLFQEAGRVIARPTLELPL